TERIELGPLVTNPYLRHPFHTAAALASLQDLASRSRLQAGAGTLACDGSAPRPTAGSVSVDLGSVPAGAGIAGAGSARAEQGATPDPGNVRADAGSVPAGADIGHDGKVRAEEGAIPADPGSARG